jgi:hypothetical protein
LQNCGLSKLPAQLSAASRLRRLRLADEHNGICFQETDLETLRSMCSLSFLTLTRVSKLDNSIYGKHVCDSATAFLRPSSPYLLVVELLLTAAAGRMSEHDARSSFMQQLHESSALSM